MRTEADALLSLRRHVAAALPAFTEILTEVENERLERPFAVVSADGDWTTDEQRAAPTVTMPCTVYLYVDGSTRADARRAAEEAREALWQALVVGDRPNGERLVPMFDYTGRPAVQRVRLGDATAGTWTVTLGSVHSGPIAARAQPRVVREAVEQLRPDLPGNVWVFGPLGGPYDLRFDGGMRGVPVATVVVSGGGLTGPAPATSVEVLSVGSPDPWRGDRDYMRIAAPTFGGLPDPGDARLRTVTVGLRLTWGRLGHVRCGEMRLRTITARAT